MRMTLQLSNTLQPISSESGGAANSSGIEGSGRYCLKPPGITNSPSSTMKKTDISEAHNNSALVASYIQEVNDQTVSDDNRQVTGDTSI